MRSDLCGTKYLADDISRLFLTLTKFSTGFKPFLMQAAVKNSSTVIASRRNSDAICRENTCDALIFDIVWLNPNCALTFALLDSVKNTAFTEMSG